MLLSLAGALGLTLLATPKTSGVYVSAETVECITGGVCTSTDLLLPSVRFTEREVVLDAVMEASTHRWRRAKEGIEVDGTGAPGWQSVDWIVLADGRVRTNLLYRSDPSLLRWIPKPVREYARQWDSKWTRDQLARHAGAWGEGDSKIVLGPKGLTRADVTRVVQVQLCLERCEGDVLRVCFREPRGGPLWVVRADGIEPVTPVDDLCWPSSGPAQAFEPTGKVLRRSERGPAAPVAQGISAGAISSAVKQKLTFRPCNGGEAPRSVTLSLDVASTGLPTAISVTGLDADEAACVRSLLWGLVVPPAPFGAPSTSVRLTVELSPRSLP